MAAGLGWRMGEGYPPKSLFEFGGRSLLRRHVELLAAHGVEEIVIGVGYRHHLIEAEVETLRDVANLRTVLNEDYTQGNIVTLWSLRHYLDCHTPVIVMDADVLYDHRLLRRLIDSRHDNCVLLDKNCDADDEPVKVCVKGARIVELSKTPNPQIGSDYFGESVGFFKFDACGARYLREVVESFVATERRDRLYEEAIRELILSQPRIDIGFEDITGLPWTEIDFYSDIEKARKQILPRLLGEEIALAAKQV